MGTSPVAGEIVSSAHAFLTIAKFILIDSAGPKEQDRIPLISLLGAELEAGELIGWAVHLCGWQEFRCLAGWVEALSADRVQHGFMAGGRVANLVGHHGAK